MADGEQYPPSIQRRVHIGMRNRDNGCNCGGCAFRPRREPMSNKDDCLLSMVLYALPTLFLVCSSLRGASNLCPWGLV